MTIHLTGTNFFEPITDGPFLATRPVWNLEVVSETPAIYRGEYLAYKVLASLTAEGRLEAAAKWTETERTTAVREFMAPRYSEGYVKGVHDHDAARILEGLVEMHLGLGLLRYPTQARACAAIFWHQFPDTERKSLIAAKLRGFATMKQLFPSPSTQASYIRELHELISEWAKRTALFEEKWFSDAAEFLYYQLKRSATELPDFAISPEAAEIFRSFEQHLTGHRFTDSFQAARQAVANDTPSTVELLRDWVRGYVSHHGATNRMEYVDEVAWLLLRGEPLGAGVMESSVTRQITGLMGSHPRIQSGGLQS
ncbi:MAG: hypothetical protein EOP84_32430 [Verrucomicrobiaceae bacterium]|nr:MAG: hypothetical protein EOP84_32430 [Verrucomicrobiaceae bacterium]